MESKTVQQKPSPLSPTDKLTLLHNALDRQPGPNWVGRRLGQKVALADAYDCIGEYEKVMALHGFDRTGGLPIDPPAMRSRKITHTEEFSGIELVDWMTTMIQTLTNAGMGKDVAFDLCMGVYTQDFLDKYITDDPVLKQSLKERITIFIVPRGNPQFKLDEDDEITAYELGGVQP